MVVHSVSSIYPNVFPNIIRIRRTGDKLSAPVNPVHTIYARFKHIKGVPSEDGGISVLKLHILDNLIDKLLSFKENIQAPTNLKHLNPDNIDSYIHDLQVTLKNRIMSIKPLFSGFYPETGMLVNLVA